MPLLGYTTLRRRLQQSHWLVEDWVLQRPAFIDDGQGGKTPNGFTTVASGGPATGNGARLSPAGYQAAERIIAERLGTTDLWRVTILPGTVVHGGDQFVITARTFQVVGIGGPGTDPTILPVTCVEVL